MNLHLTGKENMIMGPIFLREMKSSVGLDLERRVLEKARLCPSSVPDELLEILFSSDS